jgi:Flp pilus assembly protein CpaB
VWWAAVAVVALTTGLTVHRLVRDAAEARDRYGRVVDVVVVERDVEPGDVLRDDDVGVERRPAALVPHGAMQDEPVGRAARAALVRGEVLVRDRVAPEGVVGAAAAVPEGWRALAVPIDATAALPISPGDRVDVLVTVMEGDTDVPTLVVATGALVIAASDSAATVAVPADRAPRVAFGIAAGHVALALRGA